MNGSRTLVLGLALAATLSTPTQLLAMDVQQFARMAPDDQKHYLAFMLQEAQKLFIEEGQRDEAQKVERLFRDVPPGAQRPLGESQFEADVASILKYIENVPPALKGTMVQPVEGVLAGVLDKNGIRLTRNFVTALHRVTRNRVFYQTEK